MRLYHNPRCSKSRQAVNLLTERGIEFEEYRYLNSGIHKDDLELLSELDGVIRMADLDKDHEVDLNDKSMIIKILQSYPKVLQRPILINNGNAVIGRPPEEILTLLP
jgi:arsenate reductase